MNRNNNIFNKSEIENKLKDFKEGKDYSIAREDKKLIYNFHSNWLRNEFGENYTTVYEVAENWDSDNFNHHREEGKYINNGKGTEITYRYEHRINKNGDFHINWGKSWGDSDVLTMNAKPAEPKKIGTGPESGEAEKHRKAIAEFDEKKRLLKNKIEELSVHKATEHLIEDEKGREHERDLRKLKRDLAETNDKIRYHEDWLVKNTNGYNNNQSDLQKENHELRQQLSTVQKQLAEVLVELKKLKNNSTVHNNKELDQQIVKNERLIKDGEKVSETEIREQVQKSEALLKDAVVNTTTSPVNDNKQDNSSLPYLIGGSALLASVGIIGYYLVKKNRGKKVV